MTEDYDEAIKMSSPYDPNNIAGALEQGPPPSFEEAMSSASAPPLTARVSTSPTVLESKYFKSKKEFHEKIGVRLNNEYNVNDDGKVSTRSKKLDKDIDALSAFLLYHNQQRPTLVMRIKGTHRENDYLNDNWMQKVTDFNYAIELTDYIQMDYGCPDIYAENEKARMCDIYHPSRPQAGAESVEEYDAKIQGKIKPLARRYLDKFIRSGSGRKKLTLHKSIAINYKKLRALVNNRLRKELGYRHEISIEFFSRFEEVEINRESFMCSSGGTFCLCLSCMWVFALPIYVVKKCIRETDTEGAKEDKKLFRDFDEQEQATRKRMQELKSQKINKDSFSTKEEYNQAKEERGEAISQCEKRQFDIQLKRDILKDNLKDEHKRLKAVWAPVFPIGREDLLYEAIKDQIK
eukprot:Nk52_evm12s289 gene=Nk52_evmTU12s289